MLKLYSYFRSSAAYRIRIALNLKGVAHEIVPVHLLRDGGENFLPAYTVKNPLALVPTLESEEGMVIQSPAILEYLEERFPTPALLPGDAPGRARVRAIAQTVISEIHPLNNLRVLDYLVQELGLDTAAKQAWYCHWVGEGLRGIEKLLVGHPATGTFCHGDTPTFADCCLVPQLYNARRFNCALDNYPTLLRIDRACAELDPFRAAAPENQPDAE